MVTRAIIEEVVDEYKYKVRIPTINKSNASSAGTSFEDLYTATVSIWPNCKPNFQIGDAVFIAFEDNLEWCPVIIGQLGRSDKTEFNSSLICDTIESVSDAYLPVTTFIGDVQPSEIECLKGINTNLQFQLEILEQRIAKLEEKINTDN